MFRLFSTALILITIIQVSYASLEIEGTRIFTEKHLKDTLGLERYETGTIDINRVISLLEDYYRTEGYSLASVYLIEKSDDNISLYIEEGRLNKILILNLSGLDTLRLKQFFRFKDRVYNAREMDATIREIQNRYGYYSIEYEIKPAPEFDESIFQIDRELNLPAIGSARLPFLDSHGKRYDLEIRINRHSAKAGTDEAGKSRFDYGLKMNFSDGFIPEIKYYHTGLFRNKDLLEAGVSTGIFYGFYLDFASAPEYKFFQADSKYTFAPIRSDIFTPVLKSLIFHSGESRPDLGLTSYHYSRINNIAAPGFTFMEELRFYAGAGFERVEFYNSKVDKSAEFIADIKRRTDYYRVFEAELKLELMPIRIGSFFNRNASIRWSNFTGEFKFTKYELNSSWDFKYDNKSVLALGFSHKKNFGETPFYHEISVRNHSFRGLSAQYTDHSLSLGNEYRFSIYREFIYGGVIFDSAVFKGNGRNTEGVNIGLASGPSLRLIFLDQFEFYCHYTRDIHFPQAEPGNNIALSLRKKW